jgi:hypothetical protein
MKTQIDSPTNTAAARPVCPPSLAHVSLADLEYLYSVGRVGFTDLILYLRAWNATPGRFTQAIWHGTAARGRIVQVDAEEMTEAARELYRTEAEQCGADISAPTPAPAPRAVELKTVDASGCNTSDPRNLQFYANGKRISYEEHTAIRRSAVRLTEETSASVNGVRTFYRTAYVPSVA